MLTPEDAQRSVTGRLAAAPAAPWCSRLIAFGRRAWQNSRKAWRSSFGLTRQEQAAVLLIATLFLIGLLAMGWERLIAG